MAKTLYELYLDNMKKAGTQKASQPAALPAIKMPTLEAPKTTPAAGSATGVKMPTVGAKKPSGVDIVKAVTQKPAAQGGGRATMPQVKKQETATDRLANIRAFGAGDYSGGGELLEKAYKTARAAVKGIGSSYANIGGSAVEGMGNLQETMQKGEYDKKVQQMKDNKAFYEQALKSGINPRTGKKLTVDEKSRYYKILNTQYTDSKISQMENIYKDATVSQKARTMEAANDAFAASDRLKASADKDVAAAKEGSGKVGQFLVDLGYTGTQLLADTAANAIAPGAGMVSMASRVYGDASAEARREGKTAGQQVLSGLKGATIEVLTEKLFGGLAKAYGTGTADALVEKMADKLTRTDAGKRVATWLINSGGEGIEEVVSDLLNPLVDRALGLDDGKSPIYTTDDVAQMGYDFLLGTAMGAIGGAGQLRGTQSTPAVQETQPVQMPTLVDANGRTAAQRQAEKPENISRLNNENGLAAYTPQERVNLSSGGRNKIVSTYQEALAFVKKALTNKKNVDRAYMGIVPNDVAGRILTESGVDISGYGVMMNGDDVRHILKGHGDSTAEAARGQVAVTESAIAQIPEVIAQPDNVYLSAESDGKGRQAIVFEKQIGDTYITIQGVANGKRLLQTDTLYIRKRRTRKPQDTMPGTSESTVPVINVRNELPQSPSFTDTTIPRELEGVNTQGMQRGREYVPVQMPVVDNHAAEPMQSAAWITPAEETSTPEKNYPSFDGQLKLPQAVRAEIEAEMAQWTAEDQAEAPTLTAEEIEASQEDAEAIGRATAMMDRDFAEMEQRAREQRRQQEEAGRQIPETLRRLGVEPYGSETDYAGAETLAREAKNSNSARRSIQKQISKMEASEKERLFARQLAEGKLTLRDIPGTLDAERLLTLADLYRAMDSDPAAALLSRRRETILERETAKMEPLLGMDVTYDEGGMTDTGKRSGSVAKRFGTLRRNLQTPARVCETEWGAAHGREVYDALFRPVTENNGRQITWVNSMLDKVRTFKDSSGNVRELNRAERALVQRLVEHQAAEGRVMKIGEQYANAVAEMDKVRKAQAEAKGVTVEEYLRKNGFIQAEKESELRRAALEYWRKTKAGELDGISRDAYISSSYPDLAEYEGGKLEGRKELYEKVMAGEVKSQSAMKIIQEAIGGGERARKYLNWLGVNWHEYEKAYLSPEAIFKRNTEAKNSRDAYKKAKRRMDSAKATNPFLSAAENVQNGQSAEDAAREFGIDRSTQEYEDLLNYQAYISAMEDLKASREADATAVQAAVQAYSGIYRELYEGINTFLVAHGYQPIGFIEGYAPHLQPEAEKTAFTKALKLLGLDDVAMELPTSISGKTAELKPYKQYNPFFQKRRGDKTEYDIAKGYEDYVYYLGNIFYHTDDIMRIRAAERYIRKTYSSEEAGEMISQAEAARNFSDAGIEEFLRMNGVVGKDTQLGEGDARNLLGDYIDKLYDQVGNVTRYSEMAKYLDNYANRLAGKQSYVDRGAEAATGRGSLNWINALSGKYGGAKLAFNFSSAINQTSQLPMVAVENGEINTARAMRDFFGKDRANFVKESNFLNGKRGVKWLLGAETGWDKFKQYGFTMTEAVDSFTAYTAVRSKYLKEVKAGKSHAEALALADEYGRRVMGSRARGEKPVLFDTKNPFWQIVTRFQLETMNSWEHVRRDLPNEYRTMASEKGKAYAAGVMGGRAARYVLYAFLANLGVGMLSGGSPVPYDVVGNTVEALGKAWGLTKSTAVATILDNVLQAVFDERLFGTPEPDDEDNADWWAALESLFGNVANDIPVVSRAAALAGIGDQTLAAADLSKAWDVVKDVKNNGFSTDTLDKALTAGGEFLYGGNQLRKTVQGTMDVARGGRYSKGKLRYQVEQTPWSFIKGALFGRSSLDEAQDYYAEKSSDFSARQTEAFGSMQDAGVTAKESYDLIQKLRGIEKTDDESRAELQRRALMASTVSGEGKAAAYYGLLASDTEKDAMDAVDAADPDTDMGEVTRLLVQFKGCKNDAQKLESLESSTLTLKQKAEMYNNLIASEETLRKQSDLEAFNGITAEGYYLYKAATLGLTVKAAKLLAIDSLNLTAAQKDALYYSEGWAESKLHEAPWHGGQTAAVRMPVVKTTGGAPVFVRVAQSAPTVQMPVVRTTAKAPVFVRVTQDVPEAVRVVKMPVVK